MPKLSKNDATDAMDLEGYEGPLHVLLALARSQKVDLLKLSDRTPGLGLVIHLQRRARRLVLSGPGGRGCGGDGHQSSRASVF